MFQALTEKLYSLPLATLFKLLEVYHALNHTKASSSLFDNSNTNRSSFTKVVGISSRDRTNFLHGYSKVVVQLQVRRELLRRTSQKEMTVEALVSFRYKLSRFSEQVCQSPARNDPFKECVDWLFIDSHATIGTKGNTDHESHSGAKRSQTIHAKYSRANLFHQVSRSTISAATDSDPTYLFRQNL